tara:strand:- start:512 stop:619 length:108 start_codon:yes stop_codon:yes gene_type:complete
MKSFNSINIDTLKKFELKIEIISGNMKRNELKPIL